MKRFTASVAVVLGLAAALVAATLASAATTETFHALFHDVSFQNNCVPPIVFCGSGVIDGFGQATTVVRVTKNVPVQGTPCFDVGGMRWMTLDDGTGTLAATFSGIRCPLANGGNASTVDFTWTVDSGASTGIFANATGSGSGVNTTAGNVQVVSLTGTITLT